MTVLTADSIRLSSRNRYFFAPLSSRWRGRPTCVKPCCIAPFLQVARVQTYARYKVRDGTTVAVVSLPPPPLLSLLLASSYLLPLPPYSFFPLPLPYHYLPPLLYLLSPPLLLPKGLTLPSLSISSTFGSPCYPSPSVCSPDSPKLHVVWLGASQAQSFLNLWCHTSSSNKY